MKVPNSFLEERHQKALGGSKHTTATLFPLVERGHTQHDGRKTSAFHFLSALSHFLTSHFLFSMNFLDCVEEPQVLLYDKYHIKSLIRNNSWLPGRGSWIPCGLMQFEVWTQNLGRCVCVPKILTRQKDGEIETQSFSPSLSGEHTHAIAKI